MAREEAAAELADWPQLTSDELPMVNRILLQERQHTHDAHLALARANAEIRLRDEELLEKDEQMLALRKDAKLHRARYNFCKAALAKKKLPPKLIPYLEVSDRMKRDR